MDFAADLPLMMADMGTPATLAGVSVVGIVRRAGAMPNIAGLAVMTTELTYLLPRASVPNGSTGAALVLLSGFDAGTYRVRRVEPEGASLTRLFLERAAA